MSELEHIIQNMNAGFSTDAGLSSHGSQGQPWSDLCGLFPREGALLYAFGGGDVFTSGLTIENNLTSATLSNAQRARWILRRGDTTRTLPEVLVTSREIFIGGTSTYTSVTPIYDEGTVTCTGTTTVSGTATGWLDAKIEPGMLMRIDTTGAGNWTNWIAIATVGGATTITLVGLGPNISPNQRPYQIRRCFGGNASVVSAAISGISKNRIFARVVNGSLFVAGSKVIGNYPGIIRVTNVINAPNGAASCVTDIILSPFTLNSTVPAKSVISTLGDIVGMEVLPDGRLLIATRETDGTNYFLSRVRVNSIDDDADWATTSTAYFNDLLGTQGGSTGVGRIGEAFTIHFSDGIVIGYPTGQQDPPLSWSRSTATRGAICPEMLGTYPGGDFFLGADLRPYVFAGQREEVIGDFSIQKILQSPNHQGTVSFSESCCGYDNITSSFHFCLNKWATGTATDIGCDHFLIREDTRQMFRREWYSVIGCIPMCPASEAGYSRVLVGRASANQGAAATNPTTTENLVGYLQYEQWSGDEGDPNENAVPPLTSSPLPYTNVCAVTQWLDFGDPTRMKTLKKVEVWCRAKAGFEGGSDEPLPGSQPETLLVAVEARPLAANRITPYGFKFASPSYFEMQVEPAKPFGDVPQFGVPSVLTEMNIGRALIDPDPQSYPPTQSLCGTHLRVGIYPKQNAAARHIPRGIWRVRLTAELGPDPQAVE